MRETTRALRLLRNRPAGDDLTSSYVRPMRWGRKLPTLPQLAVYGEHDLRANLGCSDDRSVGYVEESEASCSTTAIGMSGALTSSDGMARNVASSVGRLVSAIVSPFSGLSRRYARYSNEPKPIQLMIVLGLRLWHKRERVRVFRAQQPRRAAWSR